jgi:hypothetical protein
MNVAAIGPAMSVAQSITVMVSSGRWCIAGRSPEG